MVVNRLAAVSIGGVSLKGKKMAENLGTFQVTTTHIQTTNEGEPKNIVSSTNASPIVMTLTAHGYSNGDIVTIRNHATNTAANGTWTVASATANTFALTGSVGNGVGGATGTAVVGEIHNVNSLGSAIAGKVSAFLKVTAISGAAASLTLKLQYSYDGINWTDLTSGAMTAITAVGFKELNGIAWAGAAPYVRYVATISGTTPVITFTLTIYMHE